MTSKFFKYAGIAASFVLIAFGIGATLMGVNGRAEVRDTLKAEQIVGTPDMDKRIAGKPVETGAEAKLFAAGIRKHTLESTNGQVYAEMGRFIDEAGKPTNDESLAAVDAKTGQPIENELRNLWITSTALTTALNTSFFAESVALFAIVMGIALLLTGIGMLVFTIRWLREPMASTPTASKAPVVPVPA
jgi:hypothetical protein